MIFHTQANYQLMPKQVDLWLLNLYQSTHTFASILNSEETARAQRFIKPQHQQRFTVARGMLRILLGRYLQQDPSTLQFHFNKYGKPYLQTSSNIEFNLSHSNNLALLAIGQQYPLGVDIEYFSQRPFIDIAKIMFSPNELEYLNNASPEQHTPIFFNIWTQKEAVIKACGIGLTYPTKTFDVSINTDNMLLLQDPVTQTSWQLHTFNLQEHYASALCAAPGMTIHLHSMLESPQLITQ